MIASWRNFAAATLIIAPFLAACTETPETVFDWGVNDHLPNHAAISHPQVAQDAAPRELNKPPSAAPTRTVSKSALAPIGHAADPNAPSFTWPVSGPVISDFGAATNGQRNDGINISAPMDTPIHASASGTVTYSGDELKAYGKLVLIRHDDGYVTAYAHADKILVVKGQAVTRGQVIGYSGSSGDVTSPQLHFEIRHDTRPVDPKGLLAARES
ncbi:MAG TPA: M23 family metallopeptidase [Rhizomicrobium sp.]|nr:M23 family metallopeptidase [Rhizomicrobium sp.]